VVTKLFYEFSLPETHWFYYANVQKILFQPAKKQVFAQKKSINGNNNLEQIRFF